MRIRARWIVAAAAIAVAAVFFPRPAAAERVTGGTVALVNVRVVSMNPAERKTTKKRQTVIVEDGRIVEIGKAKKVDVPDGATVVNGKNKLYVLPGLADMHIHNSGIPAIPEFAGPEDLYLLYFANGVTTVLDMSGFKQLFAWRRDIDRGKAVGPDLRFTSPIIDEEDYASLADLEADIRKWEREGYAWIKSHAVDTTAFLDHLFAVANELGIPVVGHAIRPGFPLDVTLDRGPLMIAHIEEILSTSVDLDNVGAAADRLEGPLQDLANRRIWVTGTVNTYEIIANTRDDATFEQLLNRPEMRLLPPSVRAAWELDNRYRRPDFAGDRDFWLQALGVKLYIAERLEQLGALDRLLLGTDTGVDGIVPGFSIHDELRLLVEAGLSPWQAILAGTYNAAAFLDALDEVGTVEEGKRADLLVATKNPLKRIGALRDLAGVMVNGVWIPREDLDARLDELAGRWAG